jgi:putative ABC transport system permease protein
LGSLVPQGLPQTHAIRVDGLVLAFALLISIVASFVFGMAPALLAVGADLQTSLREGAGRAGGSGARQRARSFLAAAEIALAMVLLIGAGLLVRSFVTLTSVKPGFDARHLLKAEVSLPQFEYSTPQQWTDFSNELLARIQAEPGMRDSAIAVPLPLANGLVILGFEIEGSVAPPSTKPRTADYVSISPEYFRVMGIPFLRGRNFNQQDFMSSPRVAIISAEMARMYFPNQDPIGKRLIFGFPPDSDVPREIVGIVGDVRDVSLSRMPGAMMYVPFQQAPFWGGVVVTRTNLSLSAAAASIRRDVNAIDKDLPITDIASMSDAIGGTVAQPRFQTFLLAMFGSLALILAAVGIYGVISYSVAQRTHEIGIRMSLGAQRKDVLQLVLGEGVKLALAGTAIGLAAAFGLTRLIAKLLYGVSATDPFTFAAVAVVLMFVALVACYIPARRAMRVDPMVALRYE